MHKIRFRYERAMTPAGKNLPLRLLFYSLFPLSLIWVSEIFFRHLQFSLASLRAIHLNPAIWLADLLPLVVFLAARINLRKFRKTEEHFRERLLEKEKRINVYAEQAKRIGRGDFSIPIVPIDDRDELGTALLFLQKFLRATQREEKNQSWISEGKDRISRILRIHTDLNDVSFEVLKSLTNYTGMEQGAFYLYDADRQMLTCLITYAFDRKKYIQREFGMGEGLVGQCAREMDYIYLTEIPEDHVTLNSGTPGDQKPNSILLVPLITEEKLQGVVEFASVRERIPKLSIQFLLELGEVIARTIYNLRMNQRTEELLEEARVLTRELRTNEAELQRNAGDMAHARDELQKTNLRLKEKIREAGEAQGKLHLLLEKASEVISIYDENVHMTYVSPSSGKILGYSPAEMMKGKDFERLTEKDAAAFRKLIIDAANDPEGVQTLQYNFMTRDGETVFLESSARNLLNDPSIRGIIVNTRDITEKLRAEKEERLKTRMQALSENSPDMIVRLSLSGQFYYANPVVEDYTSIGEANLMNRHLSEVRFPQALQEYFSFTLGSMRHCPEKSNTEISVSVFLGEKIMERILNIDAIPELNGGELETVLFVGHDVTRAKRIEREIHEKNKKIEDSIRYAEKIQTALLPDTAMIERQLGKSFVYYKPRDVISGDFPWFFKKNGDMYIAAVDCTGHGVPGALLSFIAFFLLKDVIDKSEGLDTGQICDRLHELFRETLGQKFSGAYASDGMDIALCKINSESSVLEFSGAHRPLYLLSGKELTEYKGDRKAIGGIPLLKKPEPDFTCHRLHLNKADKVFFFTDGLTDQLGGPYGRKYSPKRVRDLLLEHPGYTMKQYHELFSAEFDQWQKGFKQLDDVLMIGIEF